MKSRSPLFIWYDSHGKGDNRYALFSTARHKKLKGLSSGSRT